MEPWGFTGKRLSRCLEPRSLNRSKDTFMNRRHFLTAGCIGTIMGAPLTMAAQPQNDPPFKMIEIDVSGNKVFCRRYGDGPAILMVHGFPRTSLMWRFLAPKLAASHSVVCVDLRAYGRSGIPPAGEDHFTYSKRAMANELVEVMAKLGFSSFTLVGHDRGGRVAYRMALDHPKNVQRLAVFDVIPILEAWSRSGRGFCCRRSSRCRKATCSALRKRSFIMRSDRVPSTGRFSKSTFPHTATLGEFTESARSTVPRRRSMSNTIVPTSRLPGELNALCCIYGPKAVPSIRSIRKRRFIGHLASMGAARR